ncbi:DUF4062 domain-containing protein [Embleya sp. NPDC001921]
MSTQDPQAAALGPGGPKRVFLSHTRDIARHPSDRSFLDAAVGAVNRVAWAPVDMQWWTAEFGTAAEVCRAKVRSCDIYVGIIGFRYGSPVRDEPHHSYVELELETATAMAIPRLLFLVDEQPTVDLPAEFFGTTDPDIRQREFRGHVRDADLVSAKVRSPAELETLLYQALVQAQWQERMTDSTRPRGGPGGWLGKATAFALGVVIADELPDDSPEGTA